ncbi:oxidoreductase CipA [Penicillium malachiteum]|uniref:Oxidoreductase CipA n=1 Tax=Penicillium malachiteum TaxID=1324776 RepID=A0AAD6HFU1_9EURO|nr:oxidoreductase CipA [Penicillium malachiteum]
MFPQKFAVAGGTGNLGPTIVEALIDANFEVIILSRSSFHNVDPRAKLQVVDYAFLESLTAALTGQDAVVNVLPSKIIPVEIHFQLIEAAHKAGVKRFLPSEYGCDTSHPPTAKLPIYCDDKVAVVKRLKEISEQESTFTFTPIVTGLFFDWGIEKNFIVNLVGPLSPIYNGGDTLFSTSTLSGIGRAVVGVREHSKETNNRHVYIASTTLTQNQLIEWAEKSDQLQREFVHTADLEEQAYKALKQTPPDAETSMLNLIRCAIFDPRYRSAFSKVDNELLGVPVLPKSEIVEILQQYV